MTLRAIIRKRLEQLVPRCIVRNITVEAPVDLQGLRQHHHPLPAVAVAADVTVAVPVADPSSSTTHAPDSTPAR